MNDSRHPVLYSRFQQISVPTAKMSNKERSRAVCFKVTDSPPKPPNSTAGDQHVGTQHLPTGTPNTIAQTDSSSSLWKLPGIDKDTFYAAALYLHTVADGLEGRLWPRGPRTRLSTRNFLDSLADCFARSKARDAPDHVSATAMVRSSQRKQITLYVAKNRSSKPSDDAKEAPEGSAVENKDFAQRLIGWFNELAGMRGQGKESYDVDPSDHKPAGDETEGDQSNSYDPSGDDSESDETGDNRELEDLPTIFITMCNFNRSRLGHYVEKISEVDLEPIERRMCVNVEKELNNGWQATKSVLVACKQFQAENSQSGLATSTSVGLAKCAFLAGRARKAPGFRQLAERVDTSASESPLRGFRLPDAIEGVKYLGRLYAAFLRFSDFCRHGRQRNWSFRYVLLDSLQDVWNGDSYLNKIRSWTGDLGLSEVSSVKSIVNGKSFLLAKTVQQRMEDIVITARDTAPVHCEMQLMMHFLRPETPTCYDYFGCSKKSCWLCWHMMVQNQKFSMKDTHRKLYPRWAFSFDFSQPQSNVAEGLRIAYYDMMSLVQDKVIKQANIGSLGPFVQSSARMTPANPKNDPSSFVGDCIRITDKLDLFRQPALHVREDARGDAQIRQVTVAFYKWEKMESASEALSKFNGYWVEAGFQMITKLDAPERMTELNQYQNCYWHEMSFPAHGSSDPNRIYWLYFRSADFPMQPNQYVLAAWRTSHGEPDQSRFPWRGDIFIFLGEIDMANIKRHPAYLYAPCVINSESCFQALVEHFESAGAGYSEETRDKVRAKDERGLITWQSLNIEGAQGGT